MKAARIACVILTVFALAISNIQIALADGDSNYIGTVSSQVTKELPKPVSFGKVHISPLAINPMPGGGTATAQATLGWTALRMDGTAKTSLSSGVTGTYSLCAQVVQMYKDGVAKGGNVQVCSSKSGGGSISTIYKVYELVAGATWRLDTYHGVSASGYNWWPPLTISAKP